MKHFTHLCIILTLLFTSACANQQSTNIQPTTTLYDKIQSAGIEILSEGRLNGSGWFASPEGHVITAGHVIWQKENIFVQTSTGKRYPAKIIAIDRGHDLALLQIESKNKPHPYLKLADQQPQPGETTFLYGAPIFRHGVLLKGYPARAKPSFEYFYNEQQYVSVYHYTGSSPSGTSGGCWINQHGQVVGNQAGLIRLGNAPVNIASVAGVEPIRKLLSTKKSANTPTLGMSIEELVEKPVPFIKRFPQNTHGIVPTRFHDISPAKEATLTNEMVVTHINDHPVIFRDDLLSQVRLYKPGETITLTAIHADSHEIKKYRVTLDSLESPIKK